MQTAAALFYVLIACSTGEQIDFEDMINDFVSRDVVFLGELHDNTAGHKMQLAVVEELHAIRPDIVISMEMFEHDVQGVLDDYLRGRIDEKTFLAHSRPWPNYQEHYRPVIEFARENGLDVIAANVPRPMAARASKQGLASTDGLPHRARQTSAEKGQYRDLFVEAIGGHAGSGGSDQVEGMYIAQCLKDDTMAESIADYIVDHPHRSPLVVHLCGRFHSDYGLGTVVRLLSRQPLLQVSVLSTLTDDDPEGADVTEALDSGHYLLVVPPEPKDEGEVQATAGRPIMGFRPELGEPSGRGLLVEEVSEGYGAAEAGLQAGDRIIRMDGQEITVLADLSKALEGYEADQMAQVVVLRGDEELDFEVRISIRKSR